MRLQENANTLSHTHTHTDKVLYARESAVVMEVAELRALSPRTVLALMAKR
jgi:hypothetical protein